MKRALLFFISFLLLVGCAPRLKTIIEYRKIGNTLKKTKSAEFDRAGNKLIERNFGQPRSNRKVQYTYKNRLKMKEVSCDYFAKQDTCVVRQIVLYQYKPEKDLRIETIYEPDSAVRLV